MRNILFFTFKFIDYDTCDMCPFIHTVRVVRWYITVIIFYFRVATTPVLPYRRQTETRRWVFRLSRRNQECLPTNIHIYACVRARVHCLRASIPAITHVYCLQTFTVQAARFVFPNARVVSHDLAQSKVGDNPGRMRVAAFPSFEVLRQLIYERSRLHE